MGATATIDVQIKMGGSFVSVKSDVLAGKGISMRYGMAGVSLTDRVASTGTLSFTLDNSAKNSGGKVGYYSPSHSNHRTGFQLGCEVKLLITDDNTSGVYTKFWGYIDKITPYPGNSGLSGTLVECVDWLDYAARAKLKGLSVQQNKRSDEVFSTLVAAVAIQPPTTDVQTGCDTFAYALDQASDDGGLNVLNEFQRIAASEFGMIYQKGDGTLVFENRTARNNTGTTLTLDDTWISGLEYVLDRKELINAVNVTVHPRTYDADAVTKVVYKLESAQQILQSTKITIECTFRDTTTGQFVAIGTLGVTTPVASTDYLFNTAEDGTGVDITSQLTVTLVRGGGNSAVLDVANSGPFDGYLTLLQVRGQGLYDHGEINSLVEDGTSQAAYGENSQSFDMPYQRSALTGGDVASYILHMAKDPLGRVTSVSFSANQVNLAMQYALSWEISNRVWVVDSVTGASTIGWINAVELQITDGGQIMCTWKICPSDNSQYWLLGTTNRSELDSTTVLGYGIYQ